MCMCACVCAVCFVYFLCCNVLQKMFDVVLQRDLTLLCIKSTPFLRSFCVSFNAIQVLDMQEMRKSGEFCHVTECDCFNHMNHIINHMTYSHSFVIFWYKNYLDLFLNHCSNNFGYDIYVIR